MKMKPVLMIAGMMLLLTACGAKQGAEAPAATEAAEAQTEVAAEAQSAETAEVPATEAAAEYTEEEPDYVEDTVLSTELFSMTVPDELKGTFLGYIKDNEISLYDKACNEDGFGGFIFSVIADKDGEVMAGGMYTKVGELTDSNGEVYEVCRSYPSDVQWDYEKYEDTPETYARLSDAVDGMIRGIKGLNGATFEYGAGMKGEELYGQTVEKYETAIKEGWDAAKPATEGMSPALFAEHDEMGYAYKDISNDGVDELLVGVISDGSEPSVVYDIYTMVKRKPASVVSGSARNSYRAMQYGGVANVFSSSAMESGIRVYIIEPGTSDLFFQYGIKYDGYTDEKNPWYTGTGSGEADDEWEPASEEDYDMWEQRATENFAKIDFIPFSK